MSGRPSLIAFAVIAALAIWGVPGPAAAVAGYDSTYVGESAFVSRAAGETADLSVFFQNSGSITWASGTGTQVDLAACLDDKVTCDVAPEEALWNPGGTKAWRSATRYATQAQSSVAPGAIGTFNYTVQVPNGSMLTTYHFNGDLVVSATGAKIHPEGYFHDVKVVQPAVVVKPTLTSVTSVAVTELLATFSVNMSCASLAGGTYVIKDTGGSVLDTTAPSSGSAQITVVPRSASGSGTNDCKTATLYTRESGSTVLTKGLTYSLQVTGVSDANGAAIDTSANSVNFASGDSTPPTATAFLFQSPSTIRVVYSEPMQTSGGTAIGSAANYRLDDLQGAAAFSSCASVAGALAADCTLSPVFTTGNNGPHTLKVTEVTDAGGILISPNPTTLTATYPPSTTRPKIITAVSSGVAQVVLTFDRRLNTASTGSGCANSGNYSTTKSDGTASGLTFSSVSCATNQVTLGINGATSGTAYNVVVTGVTDLFGNVVDPSPASVAFTAGTDTSSPTVTAVTVPSVDLACDVTSPAPCHRSQFTVQFSEPMTQGTTTTGVSNTGSYVLTDPAGNTVAISSCAAVDDRNVGVSNAVTCVLTRPVTAAGNYSVRVGTGNAPTDVTGNGLTTKTLTIAFR